jgi:hypothetical protein
MTNAISSTEDRALQLLGQGIGPEMVASALGVTVSRISQLVSDPEFAARIAELRFKNLSKHNERDNRYDTLEEKLLEKLEDLLPLMMRPMEIVKTIATINGAKRRGSSVPEHITNQQTVIPLVLPIQIIQQFQNFQVNQVGQVIKAGNQDLTTVQSGSMNKLLESRKSKELVYEHTIQPNKEATGASSSGG